MRRARHRSSHARANGRTDGRTYVRTDRRTAQPSLWPVRMLTMMVMSVPLLPMLCTELEPHRPPPST